MVMYHYMSLLLYPCRLLVRSSDHYLHGLVPISQLDCNKLSQDEVAQAVGRAMNLLTILKPVQHPNISLELLRVDETFVKNHLKIGVMQVKSGQHSEEDIFANDHQPGPFDEFLNLLGKRVKLLGFKKFLGGLDGDRNLTGEHSVFTEYQSMEVMFHVSTLIPFTANDPQQVQTSLPPSIHFSLSLSLHPFLSSSFDDDLFISLTGEQEASYW